MSQDFPAKHGEHMQAPSDEHVPCSHTVLNNILFVIIIIRLLVHGQVTIIFVVSFGLSVCLFVVQSFS